MYEAHPVFVQPDNVHIKVWRYMDFTNLVSLLDSRHLFFTRADRLEDPFEGSWPRINVVARQHVPDDISPEARDGFVKTMASMGDINKRWPKYNAINCWHMNEHESAAMWRLYLKSDEGVAIQPTYHRLRSALTDDEKIHLGVVKYIDYETEWIDVGNMLNMLSPFVHKRKSFEHEREVRAVVTKWPVGEKGMDFSQETISDGIKIKVDIERLIERIYVAPSSPDWFADLVRAVVQRYGYDFPVVHSKLSEQPVF
ncbi:DUF2971 domain-containing protein [Candidatus Bathyarchaeota archaeon]|nr:DUF2971 domain-containing protein [Candidatus Bathyarchaeota archaeon]